MAIHEASWDHELRDTLTHKRFAMCLGMATELLGLVAQQTGPNPTYSDLQDMMDMQLELEGENFQMNKDLACFLLSRTTYGDVSALGRATEESVRDTLSISEAFFLEVEDADGRFSELQGYLFGAGRPNQVLSQQGY